MPRKSIFVASCCLVFGLATIVVANAGFLNFSVFSTGNVVGESESFSYFSSLTGGDGATGAMSSTGFSVGLGYEHVQRKFPLPFIVSTVTPEDGSSFHGVGIVPIVEFTRAVDAATLTTTSFHMTEEVSQLPVTGTVASNFDVGTFSPSTPLQPGTTYRMTLESEVSAIDGRSLEANETWTFSTAPALTLPREFIEEGGDPGVFGGDYTDIVLQVQSGYVDLNALQIGIGLSFFSGNDLQVSTVADNEGLLSVVVHVNTTFADESLALGDSSFISVFDQTNGWEISNVSTAVRCEVVAADESLSYASGDPFLLAHSEHLGVEDSRRALKVRVESGDGGPFPDVVYFQSVDSNRDLIAEVAIPLVSISNTVAESQLDLFVATNEEIENATVATGATVVEGIEDGYLIGDHKFEIALKVCRIVSIDMLPTANTLDANPHPIAPIGQRIFPGKQTPADLAPRDTMTIAVTVEPSMSGIEIFFRSFDVDDPSSNAAPVDSAGAAGNDNRGVNNAGVLSATSANTSIAGIATVTFTVTKHPGDNFRVAASCDESEVEALQVTNPTNPGFVTANNDPIAEFRGVTTDLLTVWRRLHVEVDSMLGVPTAYGDREPDVVLVQATNVNPGVPTAGQTTIKIDARLGDSVDFYEGGSFTSQTGAWQFQVVSNTDNLVSYDEFVILGVPTAAEIADMIAGPHPLADDDHNDLLPIDDPISQFVKDAYAYAYIDIVAADEALNPNRRVFFDNYLGGYEFQVEVNAGVESRAAIDLDPFDPDFWVHQLVVGYQPDAGQDGDPDPFPNSAIGENTDFNPGGVPPGRPNGEAEPLTGLTLPNTGRPTVIYVETIRDQNFDLVAGLPQQNVRTNLDHVVAHEIGHGTTAGDETSHHAENGIMTRGAIDSQNDFSNDTLDRFRSTVQW